MVHRKILPILWKDFENRLELEQLAVKFGQMLSLLHTHGDDAGDARYLVPSVLPQRPLAGPRPLAKLSAFIVVASADRIKCWDCSVTVQQVLP